MADFDELDPLCFNEDELLASICKSSFEEFAKVFWQYVPGAGESPLWNWHLSLICDELQAIAKKVFNNEPKEYDLLINISPGTSKSTLCSILFPAWTWINMPHARHIIASHTDTLVLDLATKSRYVVESELYKRLFPYIQLRHDQATKGYFANTLGGDRVSCTVGGKSPVGFHAHFLCLVQGTPVLTEYGLIPIEQIKVGTRVATRKGLRNVVKSGMTKKERYLATLYLQDGSTITGTWDHRVWTEEEGWLALGDFELDAHYTFISLKGNNPSNGWTLTKTCLEFPVPVYDIVVEEEHEFFANGILVHNSFDDPIDPQKAMSEVEIMNAANFAPNVLFTRKVDKAVSVFYGIMQRLHPNDPSGTLLKAAKDKEGADPVRLICLPAELADNVNPPELRKYYIDGLMDPVRLSRKILKPYKANAYSYAGQFMQSPVPLGGGMFKEVYFNLRVKAAPHDCRRVRFWDRACLVKDTGVAVYGGFKAIQDIVPGDMVMIRRAKNDPLTTFKKVLWADQTGYDSDIVSVQFKDGCVVSGTYEHLVWVVNEDAWVHLGCLKEGDVVYSCSDKAEFTDDYGSPWTVVIRKAIRRFDPPLPVYDIEVEDAHEFFANGILVHNSTADGGCYTAGTLLGRDKNDSYYVEHVKHGQWEPTERNQIMRATALRDRAKYGPNNEPTILVEREGGSSGRDAWLGVVKALQGFRVIEVQVTGQKDARAEPLSTQFAAGNFYLVEDGTWDINGYIEEFVNFRPVAGKRLGKYKDQVDSTSGAFNYLSSIKMSVQMRVITFGKNKQNFLRIVVCSRDELRDVIIDDHRCLLLMLDLPEPLSNTETPIHGMTKLLDTYTSQFANIEPIHYQDKWEQEIPEYGKTPDQLIMTPEQGKKIWAFILKKRDPIPDVWVVCDTGDGRALSVAYALCDMLRHDRNKTLHIVGQPDNTDESHSGKQSPNQHVFSVMKSARHLVM